MMATSGYFVAGQRGFKNSAATKTAGVDELRGSVMDCGSPLPLFLRRTGDVKRQRAAAVQNLAELSGKPFRAATVLFQALISGVAACPSLCREAAWSSLAPREATADQ